jgi:hypothetical protein
MFDAKLRLFHPFAALALLPAVAVASPEWLRTARLEALPARARGALGAVIAVCSALSERSLANAWWLIPLAAAAIVLLVLALRRPLLWWHNTVVAKPADAAGGATAPCAGVETSVGAF